MKLSLTSVKKETLPLAILATIIIILLGFVITQQILKNRPFQTAQLPPPIKLQPVVNGKFDTNAPISQKSKASVELLKQHLPYKADFVSTTGDKITYTLYGKTIDPYTLYVDISNIDFLIPSTNPNYPKTIQDFRDTANHIFEYMKQYNANPSDVFISWGSQAYIQNNAELWLTVSDKFPPVVKKDNQYIFETPPK